MTVRFDSMTPGSLARLAGLLYLIVAVCGGFAQIVRVTLMETGDAEATAANILDNQWLFRLGFSSDIVAFSTEVALGLVVFALFRSYSTPLALLAAFFRLSQAAVLGINMLNQFFVLLILSGDDYLTVFDDAQLDALALLFLDAHSYGYFIGLVFFGLHNIVLGYLVIKSGLFPRILGLLLMLVVSTGYLIDSFGNFLLEDYPSMLSVIVVTPAALVEFAFIFWLLLRGGKVGQQPASTGTGS